MACRPALERALVARRLRRRNYPANEPVHLLMAPDPRPLTGPMARIRRHRVALGIAGLAMAALIIVGWLALPGFWHRHVLQLGATDIHDPALLDDRISVCGRQWNRDETGREFTRSQLQATFGDNVVLV